MPKVKEKIKKAVCSKCGVDVRENTLFCYNCGTQVAEGTGDLKPGAVGSNGSESSAAPDIRSALDDLAESIKIEEPHGEGTLAKAAAARKKARVSHRKSNEYIWEPSEDSRFALVMAILIAVLALVVVFLTVFWK